tara:strand:- start:1474 stop:2808 length:1335 start_codon:yes stop_codon:yes gene_type:complete
VIKKIKIELSIIALLFLNIFVSSNIDISLYNKFSNFSDSLNNVYFKDFFVNLTVVGDSLWFFSIAIIGYFLCFLFQRIIKWGRPVITNKFKYFFLFLFFGTLITGVLTQILKHVIGRPRPNHAIKNGSFDIDFLNFDSAFHSFPSGHTSTIFLVALIMSLYTPKIKYFYFFLAGLVALSRVVVGAHYFTDVVGGIVLACIGFKITKVLFGYFKIKKEISTIEKINSDLFFLSLIVFFVFILFVTIGSSVDIYISNLFYYGQQQFVLQSFNTVTILTRKIFLPLLLVYLLILPFFALWVPIKKIYFGFDFSYRIILFIYFSLVVNLIFVVNLILKNFWGRARPNDVLELGGKDVFTPWFHYSEACNTNCSFVSGDASVGFSLIVLYFLTKNTNFFWASLFSGFFIGLIRILEGGHFFSDILLAGFLVYVLTFLQFKFYKRFYNVP